MIPEATETLHSTLDEIEIEIVSLHPAINGIYLDYIPWDTLDPGLGSEVLTKGSDQSKICHGTRSCFDPRHACQT